MNYVLACVTMYSIMMVWAPLLFFPEILKCISIKRINNIHSSLCTSLCTLQAAWKRFSSASQDNVFFIIIHVPNSKPKWHQYDSWTGCIYYIFTFIFIPFYIQIHFSLNEIIKLRCTILRDGSISRCGGALLISHGMINCSQHLNHELRVQSHTVARLLPNLLMLLWASGYTQPNKKKKQSQGKSKVWVSLTTKHSRLFPD